MKTSFISFTLGVAAFAYAAWSSVFQTGLYAMLVRWQAATFDTYLPFLTFVAIFMGLLSLIVLVGRLLSFADGTSKSDVDNSLEGVQTRFKKRTRVALIAMLFFAGAGFAAFFVGQSAPGDKQDSLKIDLANYQGEFLWFKKVELDGELLSSRSYSIITKNTRRGGDSQTTYTPIVSSANTKSPVHFVHIKTSNHNFRTNSRFALSGFVSPVVLPVLVRDSFEENGVVLADKVHVIGKSIVSLQMVFYIAAGISGLIAFLCLITVVLSPIGKRRVIKEWHAANDGR